MKARLYRLNELHQRIDEQLQNEQRRVMPDPFAMTRLKKTKLRIKDLMHRMTPRQASA